MGLAVPRSTAPGAVRECDHERGPGLGDSLLAWKTRTGQLAIFGFVRLVVGRLWGRATRVMFAVTFDGMPTAPRWFGAQHRRVPAPDEKRRQA